MAKEAYYFSHDMNARRDPKILAMRTEYGNEGYGWYWILIEMLAEQEGYKMEHKKWTFYGIAMEMLCDANTAEKFVNSLVEDYELLVSDGTSFWSESLLRRMEFKDEKKKKRIAAGKKGAQSRWGKPDDSKENKKTTEKKDSNAIATAYQSNSNSMANDGKGNESKVKESKVNKTKVNNNNESDDVVVSPGPNAHEFYQNNFGIENSIISQNIDFWIDDLNEELVIEAMSRAALDKKGFRYAEGILKNWEKEGIKTMDEVKSADIAFENSKKKPSYGGNPSIRKETLPDWAKEENQQVVEKPMSEEEKAAFMERLKKIQSFDREKETQIESTLHGFKVENKRS